MCVFFLLLFLILFTALPCLSATSSYAIRSAFAHSIQLHAHVFVLDEKKSDANFFRAYGVTSDFKQNEKKHTRKMKIAQEIRLSARRAKALFRVLAPALCNPLSLSDSQSNQADVRQICKKMSAESELCRNVIAQKICGIAGE